MFLCTQSSLSAVVPHRSIIFSNIISQPDWLSTSIYLVTFLLYIFLCPFLLFQYPSFFFFLFRFHFLQSFSFSIRLLFCSTNLFFQYPSIVFSMHLHFPVSVILLQYLQRFTIHLSLQYLSSVPIRLWPASLPGIGYCMDTLPLVDVVILGTRVLDALYHCNAADTGQFMPFCFQSSKSVLQNQTHSHDQ